MTDLIDRQAAIDALMDSVTPYVLIDDNGNIESVCKDKDVIAMLYSLPSAQPEIIRCKDCKWCNMGECEHKLGLFVANDENYCSYAERRAGDDIR